MTVRWIENQVVHGVRWLGDLGRPKNVHARTVLAAWNKSQNFIMLGYPNLDDMLQENWTYRDRRMLGSFVIWWNNTANPPLLNWGQFALPPPTYFHGVQNSDLTEQHLAALDTWAMKMGAGPPMCLEKCFDAAIGAPTQAQMQACIDSCASTSGHPGGGLPQPPGGPGPKCPPGMIWDEPTQGCVQPPATGPLPPPPAPIPAPTTTTSGTTSGVGLLIGGAIALAAVAIFAATVSGGFSMPKVKANPKKRRRRRNPGPTYGQGVAPIANPCDYDWTRELYYFSLGAYGSTHVYVWANSADDAMEEMVEWVDDNAPGLLSWSESEEDEVDMYVVGHTTLEHGNVMPSWEIHFDEVTGKKKAAVKRLSQIECEDEGPLPLPSGG
jgi:hypothetical protein